MTAARPIVIVGLPRSGTTWTLRALGRAVGTQPILEPDNEDKHPAAIHGKRKVGRYPVLEPGDRAPSYRRLWEWVLAGAEETRGSMMARRLLGPGYDDRIHDGRFDPVTRLAGALAANPRSATHPDRSAEGTRVVAKSIHAQLSVEWLASEFAVDILLLFRHPASVLASWMELNLKDARNSTLETRPEIRARYTDRWGVPQPGPDPIEQMSWRIGLLTAALDEARADHPDWHVRSHEALCDDPQAQFRALFDELGLEWTGTAESYLRDHDTPGRGFTVDRVASELSGSWRRRLDAGQVATLRRVLAWFPITSWSDQDFEGDPT